MKKTKKKQTFNEKFSDMYSGKDIIDDTPLDGKAHIELTPDFADAVQSSRTIRKNMDDAFDEQDKLVKEFISLQDLVENPKIKSRPELKAMKLSEALNEDYSNFIGHPLKDFLNSVETNTSINIDYGTKDRITGQSGFSGKANQIPWYASDKLIKDIQLGDDRYYKFKVLTEDLDVFDHIEDEVYATLDAAGYDMSSPEVYNFIEAATDYITMHNDAGDTLSVNQWWEDTLANFPEEVAGLPKVNGLTEAVSDESAFVDNGSTMIVDLSQLITESEEAPSKEPFRINEDASDEDESEFDFERGVHKDDWAKWGTGGSKLDGLYKSVKVVAADEDDNPLFVTQVAYLSTVGKVIDRIKNNPPDGTTQLYVVRSDGKEVYLEFRNEDGTWDLIEDNRDMLIPSEDRPSKLNKIVADLSSESKEFVGHLRELERPDGSRGGFDEREIGFNPDTETFHLSSPNMDQIEWAQKVADHYGLECSEVTQGARGKYYMNIYAPGITSDPLLDD